MPTSFERADKARADIADLLDLQLSPLGLAAIEALAPEPGQTILDVGCGAGQTITQLAERVGETGRVIGVDIGAQSLAVARSRAARLPQVTLMQEDAAALTLPAQSLNGIYSRFGVMFFDDPIGAFSNLHRMTTKGGRISFVCWRPWQENELDLFPIQHAGLDAAIDEAPFSFEQPSYVTTVLRSSGFTEVSIRKLDVPVSCGGVDETVEVLTKVGALGKILRETPALMNDAAPRVRAALLARRNSNQVELGAATWLVTAVAE